MERRLALNPYDFVIHFTGEVGIVMSTEMYELARSRLREGKRPGRYFALGCCHNPDYVTQVPVLFEDGSYDVMRPMNVRRTQDLPLEKRSAIERLAEDLF
jgi:hypothetical protein